MWQRPGNEPQVSMETPSEPAQEVEADFKFFLGTPIFHLIDRAHRFHGGSVTPDRSENSIREALRPWLTYMGKMLRLYIDQESAASSDSFGIWLQKRGIQRKLVRNHTWAWWNAMEKS